ncbi:FAD-dependent thymidylate synthase [Myxococcota bacterium]|nr:FAD-dependent thymidylate synthase [Myxococcota bacterium]
MKLNIAGYNIDTTVISAAMDAGLDPSLFTPEIISAAYARISRSPDTVEELRAEARENVPKARKSNQSIVFDMGHSSIAEHAVFNIDIQDISRLALEEIERHRLASYTEKSQRYVEVGKDYMIPAEWSSEEDRAALERLQKAASAFYFSLLEAGIDKEDARYYLPLSLTGQLGATLNTRTLEHMILAFAASPLAEMNELGTLLNREISAVAPSLVRYVEPSEYHRREYSQGLFGNQDIDPESLTGQVVSLDGSDLGTLALLMRPDQVDTRVLAMRMSRQRGIPFSRALALAGALSADQQNTEFQALLSPLGLHDSAPSELEHFTYTWEIILSAAAFAQLKRHRLSGITCSAYSPALGFTHPPALSPEQRAAAAPLIELSHETFLRMAPHGAAQYALLSGHRRRVTWTANLREHYHFSRLREDGHAQWDIRAFAFAMADTIRESAPLTAGMLCGKDRFPVIKARFTS